MPSKRLMKIVAFVLVAALAVVAWLFAHRNDSQFAPDQPSVILISIDTCRADHLGCYNPEWATTPSIDTFAESATLFASAVAPTPMTLPSHTSMLTGRIPLAHGVHDNGQFVPEANETLAETAPTAAAAVDPLDNPSSHVDPHRRGLHWRLQP